MVTAYDAPSARFADDAGIDVVLVGDTAAMVVLGHEGTTVPVTVDEMLFLTRTVARRRGGRSWSATCRSARTRSPTRTPSETRSASSRRAGADVVKLEGAGPMTSRVHARSSTPGSRSWGTSA